MCKSNRVAAVQIALGSAGAVILLLLLLLMLWRPVLGDARRPSGPVTASAPAPAGLIVLIADKPQQPLNLKPLDNPYISGVSLQIHWADLEPVEGKPDWAKLDRLFAAAESSNKWVQLAIFPGFFSPAWALEGVQTENFPLQYGPGKGKDTPLPVPWDRVYLRRWLAFMKRLSDRYGNSPAFRLVAADGPTSVSAECTLPKSPADLKKWQHLGYRPSKYVAAWKDVLQAYADDFPNQYVSLAVGAGQVNIDEAGKIDRHDPLRTRQEIVDAAQMILGRRFVLQMCDVHAGPGPRGATSEAENKFVIAYNGKVITGFQLGTNALHQSAFMGAEGDPPLALKKSIDLALRTNEAGQHVNYLEIHEADVTAKEMQAELQAAAAAFAPERMKR